MRLTTLTLIIVCGLFCSFVLRQASAASAAPEADDRAAIERLLDEFHAAAAAGDRDRYLGLFAPDAVFLGTDDWERWPLDDFRSYVEQRFSGGRGWVYRARDRHVMFGPQGDTAWFDEIAVSPRWGRFRGTGVVQRIDGHWRVAHYSLTLLVPNERFEAIADEALTGFEARDPGAAPGGRDGAENGG